ncbi:MAG: hypothetical protein ACRCXZ_00095 [Patescibacteria group bacterium]
MGNLTPLTETDLSNMNFTVSHQMHLLRHFESVSEHYKSTVMGKEFLEWSGMENRYVPNVVTKDLIDSFLATKGSKFDSVQNPHLNPNTLFHSIMRSLYEEVEFGFDKPMWKETRNGKTNCTVVIRGVIFGFCNLISFDQLNEGEIEKVYQNPRGSHADNFLVNMVDRNHLIPSDELVVNLIKEVGCDPFIATAFNGIITERFPSEQVQSPEEFAKSKEFWDRHAFVNLVK